MLGEVGHGDILISSHATCVHDNHIADDITLGKSAAGDYVSTMATTVPRFLVHLPTNLQAEVENYRWERRIESRSAAIRALVELGLKAAKATKADTKAPKRTT